ncbi:hypothetical protein MMC13_004399 [Lambiella insularis]|nr:hypothetical protein [Lambiella insularis]
MALPLMSMTFWGGILIAVTIIYQIVYNVFFSPLRKIPGPLLAKVTSRWLMVVDLAGYRTLTLHKLHQQYGTAVRIGPDEVSFSNIDEIKQLYGQQTTFLKAPIYETMSQEPLGIFSLREKSAHSQRRKLLSHAFAQSNLFDTEPLILHHVQRLVDRVQKNSGKPLNMLALFRLVAFDIVGELFLGQDFGGLLAEKMPQFLHDMDNHFILSGIESSFPWLYILLSQLPIPKIRNFFNSRPQLAQYGKDAFEKYISQYGRDSGRRDLLTKVLSVKPGAGEAVLTDRQSYMEVANLVFAGTDTTSTTLTYMFWELAQNPLWQDRLHKELLAHSLPADQTLSRFLELDDLPVLEAVINEALRLHPAAPASLQRETPAGGKELDGYYIPAKTVVSMQCYTTQRDPSAFPQPDVFDPARWMEPNVVTSDMKELFMPFSKGSRACLGKGLAMMELKLISAALLRSSEVERAPTATKDCMTMTDHFLVLPKGGKCELIFNPREKV